MSVGQVRNQWLALLAYRNNCYRSLHYVQDTSIYPLHAIANNAFWPAFQPVLARQASYMYNSQFLRHHLANAALQRTPVTNHPFYCVVPLQTHLNHSQFQTSFPVLTSSVRNDVAASAAGCTVTSAASTVDTCASDCSLTPSCMSSIPFPAEAELTTVTTAYTDTFLNSSAEVKFSHSASITATNVTEIKTCDSCEVPSSYPVGVSTQSSTSIANSVKPALTTTSMVTSSPTKPEVVERRKIVVTPFTSLTPVQVSLLKLAADSRAEVPKLRKRAESKNVPTTVDRKVVFGADGLTVSFCPPTSTNASSVLQLDDFVNRKVVTSLPSEENVSVVDTKVLYSSAGVSLAVPQWSLVGNTDEHCQLETGERKAESWCNAASCSDSNVNLTVACSHPNLSVFQPFIASIPGTDTNMSVQPKCLTKSQRRRRNKAMKKLMSNSGDVNQLSSSLQQSVTPASCMTTDNSETMNSTCSKRSKIDTSNKQSSRNSHEFTPSVQPVNFQFHCPPQVQVSSTKVASSKEVIHGKTTVSPAFVSSSLASPTQYCSSASASAMMNSDSKSIVCSTSTRTAVTGSCGNSQNIVGACKVKEADADVNTASVVHLSDDETKYIVIDSDEFCDEDTEVLQLVPELLVSFIEDCTSPAVCQPDLEDCKTSEDLDTDSMRDAITSSVIGPEVATDAIPVIDLTESPDSAFIPVSDETSCAFISADNVDKLAVTQPAASSSLSDLPHVIKTLVNCNVKATVSQQNSSLSSVRPSSFLTADAVSTVTAVGNALHYQTEKNLIPTTSANTQTMSLFPRIAEVSRQERKRKYAETRISVSEAIVIDDEDTDEVSIRETSITCVDLQAKQPSSSESNRCKISYLFVFIVDL